MQQEKKYQAPAAETMLKLLEFMADHPGSWGVSELSSAIRDGKNIVFRVLNVLAENGYAIKNESGKYELGAKLFSLGMKLHNRFELRFKARPFLRRLAEQTGETCQLQIPDGNRMLSVDVISPPSDYYLMVNPGARLFYHANAFGKAVMAFLDKETLKKLLKAPLKQLTPFTVTSPSAIREELAVIRKTRIAAEHNEYVNGSFCIGSPVFDATGRVIAGIGISALSSRMKPQEEETMKHWVLECASAISASLGYEPEASLPLAARESGKES